MKAEWYKYLEHSGFIDIEERNGLKGRQIFTKSIKYDDAINQQEIVGLELFQQRVNYYTWAKSKLNDGRFDSERDKLIWEYHTEGLSTRQISPRIGLEQSWTVRKINKIKSYLRDQYEMIGSMSMQMATS